MGGTQNTEFYFGVFWKPKGKTTWKT